jgi:Uma2 family endonuclease
MSVMAMATEPAPEPASQGGRPFTRADLEGMPDDGRRYEIIDGVLIVSAAPGRLHQRAVGRLYRALDDACPDGLEVLIAPFAIALSEDSEIQPDLLVGHDDEFTDRNLVGRPLLAVEVLSPSSRLLDTHVKRARFERAGTPSYWVVDPVARPEEARLVVWELGGDRRYREVGKAVGEEAFTASAPFPVTVIPADLVR